MVSRTQKQEKKFEGLTVASRKKILKLFILL